MLFEKANRYIFFTSVYKCESTIDAAKHAMDLRKLVAVFKNEPPPSVRAIPGKRYREREFVTVVPSQKRTQYRQKTSHFFRTTTQSYNFQAAHRVVVVE
jgi:hypothetical protein